MKCTSSMRLRQGGIWAALAVALSLAACGGKEEAPPPQASAPAAPAPETPAPVVVDDAGGEAMVIQPSLVDTLSVDELLIRADEAVKERQLFVPSGESAFEMYLSVIEQEPVQVRARNALSDLFPYAVMYVEQRTTAGDLAESERVLDLMVRADEKAPALPRLQRGVDELRNRVSAEAQRLAAAQQAAEAQRAAAQTAAATAAATPPPQQPAPVAPTPAPTQPETPAPQPEPVAAAPAPAPVVPPPAPTPAPPPAAAPAPVAPTVISSVQPRYPPVALRRRVEGSVEVGFTIMPDGSVSNVRVLSSRPNNTFDREAINAMERWRFTPPGRQVESRRVFDFKLSE